MRRLSTTFALASATLARASQDSAYYPFNNPNVRKNKMYYRDAVNVLQDIDAGKFSALFIEYHGCVWSEYGTSGEEGVCGDGGAKMYQVNNNNGQNYYGNNYKQPWYQGHTQCFRANAAYSLYGIPSGSSSTEGCSEKHFINSFFTTYGIESFGEPLAVDYETAGASSFCVSKRYRNQGSGNSEDENNENGNNNNANYGYGQYHGEVTFNNYVSYTTGCARNGNGFVKAMFQGAYCDGSNYLSTTNTLDNFNAGLETMECTQVYSDDDEASAYYTANNFQNQNNGNGDGWVAQANGEKSMAFQLLAYSKACSIVEYPDKCPDPFGIKGAQDMRLYQRGQANQRPVPIVMPIFSSMLFMGAVILFFMSCAIRGRTATMEHDRKEAIKERKQAQFSKEEYPNNLGATLRLFARSTSNFSTASVSVFERLKAYAEEEVDDSESEYSEEEQSSAVRNPRDWSEPDGTDIQLPPSMDKSEQPMNKSTDKSRDTSDPEAAVATTKSSQSRDLEDPPVMIENVTESGSVAASVSVSMPPPDGGILVGQVDVLADQLQAIATMSKDHDETEDEQLDPSVAKSGSRSSVRMSRSAESSAAAPTTSSDGSAVVVNSPTDADDDRTDNNAAVADALLAERGIIPPPSAENSTSLKTTKANKKKYKRPMLAKVSKFLFRGSKKKNKTSTSN